MVVNVTLTLMILFILPVFITLGTDYQLNSYLGPEPTIDGVVDEDERNAAGKPEEMLMPFNPWFMGGDQTPREIEIGSVYTEDAYLYIYTKIKFDSILEGNISYYIRKLGTEDYFDYKSISSLTNSSFDGYRIPEVLPYPEDTESGGTKDSEGKCFISDDYMTFELLIPYASTDVKGYDLNVTLSDEIEIRYYIQLKYLNTSYDPWNHYSWLNADLWTIAFQETSAVAIPLISIILGLIAIPLLAVKRKHKINYLS